MMVQKSSNVSFDTKLARCLTNDPVALRSWRRVCLAPVSLQNSCCLQMVMGAAAAAAAAAAAEGMILDELLV